MTPRTTQRYGWAVLVAVPLLLPWLIGRLPGWTFDLGWPRAAPMAVVQQVAGDDGFRIEAMAIDGGFPIFAGDDFGQLEGAELPREIRSAVSARGRTRLPDDAPVWALMVGRGGEAYLQAPRVIVRHGAWVSPNLRVGEPVARIVWVEADAATDAAWRRKAQAQDWTPLPRLPDGARELAAITLR